MDRRKTADCSCGFHPGLAGILHRVYRALSLQEIALEVSKRCLETMFPAQALTGIVERALNFDAPW